MKIHGDDNKNSFHHIISPNNRTNVAATGSNAQGECGQRWSDVTSRRVDAGREAAKKANRKLAVLMADANGYSRELAERARNRKKVGKVLNNPKL